MEEGGGGIDGDCFCSMSEWKESSNSPLFVRLG
jgi:hypothetical protein